MFWDQLVDVQMYIPLQICVCIYIYIYIHAYVSVVGGKVRSRFLEPLVRYANVYTFIDMDMHIHMYIYKGTVWYSGTCWQVNVYTFVNT